MADYIPDKDLEFQVWVANFLGVAGGELTTLGLTTSDLTALTTETGNFSNMISSIIDLKAQYENAIISKDVLKKSAESNVRGLVNRIQAHPGVPEGLKAQLGITVRSGSRARTVPLQPATLVATPQADGTNSLKWHKAGNKPSTQFVVYAKPLTNGASVNADSGWTIVGQTTRSDFQHQGVTPGMPMAYKVQAARAGFASPASIPATVYVS